MGALEQLGMSGQGGKQCPWRWWALQGPVMGALKWPPHPGQEASRLKEVPVSGVYLSSQWRRRGMLELRVWALNSGDMRME